MTRALFLKLLNENGGSGEIFSVSEDDIARKKLKKNKPNEKKPSLFNVHKNSQELEG